MPVNMHRDRRNDRGSKWLAILGGVMVCGLLQAGWAQGSLITPDFTLDSLDWTEEELRAGIAKRTIVTTPTASHHMIRLRTSEKPHVHEKQDLVFFVLKGRLQVHLKDRVVLASAGDVVDIPKGIEHWASNHSSGASVVYAVFSPPLVRAPTPASSQGESSPKV